MGALKEKYWLNFVGEAVLNSKYFDYIAGRVEIQDDESDYSIDEYRYFVHKDKWDKFYDFREEWDWKDVSEEKLKWLKEYLEANFNDFNSIV